MGASEPLRAAPRDIAFDILKGIGIAEVLIHHTFSFSARKFSNEGSSEWWGLMMANRVLHFAIPTFLLISALLLARSLSKHDKFDFGRYAKRRIVRSLWPFVVWSVLYLLFRAYILRVGADIVPYTLTLPWGGSLTGPTVLLDPIELRHDLYWGKAYFHLYFLSVLLQLSILLPFAVWGLRRLRLTFGGIALVAAALQIGVYLLQAGVWRSPHPASMALWYLPSILVGAWLGIHWDEWPAIWARRHRWIGGLALAGGAPYLVLSAMSLADMRISTLAYNASFSLYGTATALFLLGIVGGLQRSSRPVSVLAALGAVSLPMFLLHPMILYYFGGPRISAVFGHIPGAPILIWAMLLGMTLALAKLLILLRLDVFLFGRSYRRELALPPIAPDPEPRLAGSAS